MMSQMKMKSLIGIGDRRPGYRAGAGIAKRGTLIINCNPDSGQEVYHLHLHVLGGRRWAVGCSAHKFKRGQPMKKKPRSDEASSHPCGDSIHAQGQAAKAKSPRVPQPRRGPVGESAADPLPRPRFPRSFRNGSVPRHRALCRGSYGSRNMHESIMKKRIRGQSRVFFHGRAGAGSDRRARQFFDPHHYRIVVFDQRVAVEAGRARASWRHPTLR